MRNCEKFVFFHSFYFAEIEILEDESNESELPLISKAQTKLEHLLEPSNLVIEESSTSSVTTEADEIDTIEAHTELIKMREKLRLEKQQTVPDQVSSKIDINLRRY